MKGNIPSIRIDTAWEFGTDSDQFKDIEDQLNYVSQSLSPHIKTIISYKETYNLDCQIFIVFHLNEYLSSGIHLDDNHIQFAEKN